MHRAGRTGRFGTDGLALTMLNIEHNEKDGVSDQVMLLQLEKKFSFQLQQINSFKDFERIYDNMRVKKDGDAV